MRVLSRLTHFLIAVRAEKWDRRATRIESLYGERALKERTG
jgi:hypothetical protein